VTIGCWLLGQKLRKDPKILCARAATRAEFVKHARVSREIFLFPPTSTEVAACTIDIWHARLVLENQRIGGQRPTLEEPDREFNKYFPQEGVFESRQDPVGDPKWRELRFALAPKRKKRLTDILGSAIVYNVPYKPCRSLEIGGRTRSTDREPQETGLPSPLDGRLPNYTPFADLAQLTGGEQVPLMITCQKLRFCFFPSDNTLRICLIGCITAIQFVELFFRDI
jgi:hypothetical protein